MLKKSKIAVLLLTSGLATATGLGYHYNLLDFNKKIQGYRVQRLLKKGREYFINYEWNNSENVFEKINEIEKKIDEKSPEVCLHLAKINEQQGDYKDAINHWEEYSNLTKEDVSEHIGTLENIIDHEEYLRKRPSNTTVREELAELYENVHGRNHFKTINEWSKVVKVKKSGPVDLEIITGENIEFRVPKWYVPTMEEYDILAITEEMYNKLEELTGVVPFDGDIQVLAYDYYSDKTHAGNPIILADSKKDNEKWGRSKAKMVDGKLVFYDYENYPMWYASSQEMGHNFTLNSKEMSALSPFFSIITEHKGRREFTQGFGEFCAYYATDITEGDFTGKGLESLKESHDMIKEIELYGESMGLKSYLDAGAKMENLSQGAVAGMLIELQEQYSWDIYKEFFRIFKVIGKDWLSLGGDDWCDANPDTNEQEVAYFTWGLVKATEKTHGKEAGEEIKNTLEERYGLRIDEGFYKKIDKEFNF